MLDMTFKVEHLLTVLTIVVAILVAYVAYNQFILAREKLKFDLFEKRFAIFKGTQSFLSDIMRNAKVTIERLFQFRGETQDKVFLFDNEITKYIDSIDERALELFRIGEELKDLPRGEQRSNLAKENSEILRWLISQLPRLKEIFSPYLKFKTWK